MGFDFSGAYKAAALVLLTVGCAGGLLLARVGPAVWRGLAAFWHAVTNS